jgi:undecaprenyl-diphosphatase
MIGVMVMAARSVRARTLLMTAAFLIALVVGLARIYLGAHWMTDVLAGWALGGAWGSLLILGYLLTQQAPTSGSGPPSARLPPAARSARTG